MNFATQHPQMYKTCKVETVQISSVLPFDSLSIAKKKGIWKREKKYTSTQHYDFIFPPNSGYI